MQESSRLLQRLTLIAVIWALMVIALGAFTRLTNAGLSCPDWPGCYGHLSVPTGAQTIQKIDKANPSHPLVTHKAWAEMIHRYFAGMLGLLILAIVILGYRTASKTGRKTLYYPLAGLLILLIYQPLLGMWTVTLKLLPIIVTQHLLGGLSFFALLTLLYLAFKQRKPTASTSPLKPFAVIGVLLLFCQIALGAWTSTNYAAITCSDFPFCQLTPWHWDFHHAFHLFSPIGQNYQGGLLNENARKTIQMVHRLGALIVSLYLFFLCSLTLFTSNTPKIIRAILVSVTLLIIQIALGIGNVLLTRPLIIAVLHNLTAALLLASLVRYSYFCYTLPHTQPEITNAQRCHSAA